MGGWLSYSVVKIDAETQTERQTRNNSKKAGNDISCFTQDEITEMVMLYRKTQEAIDRSSIRGVQRTKNHYDAISKSLRKQIDAQPQHFPRPNFDPDSLHRRNHPKGYLTRITQDYRAKSDEEMSVQKGIMVKVLRNHRDGRYEVYYSGAFGLVPGKVLSYVQYEPEP